MSTQGFSVMKIKSGSAFLGEKEECSEGMLQS